MAHIQDNKLIPHIPWNELYAGQDAAVEASTRYQAMPIKRDLECMISARFIQSSFFRIHLAGCSVSGANLTMLDVLWICLVVAMLNCSSETSSGSAFYKSSQMDMKCIGVILLIAMCDHTTPNNPQNTFHHAKITWCISNKLQH